VKLNNFCVGAMVARESLVTMVCKDLMAMLALWATPVIREARVHQEMQDSLVSG
jgi:hypothetical protein